MQENPNEKIHYQMQLFHQNQLNLLIRRYHQGRLNIPELLLTDRAKNIRIDVFTSFGVLLHKGDGLEKIERDIPTARSIFEHAAGRGYSWAILQWAFSLYHHEPTNKPKAIRLFASLKSRAWELKEYEGIINAFAAQHKKNKKKRKKKNKNGPPLKKSFSP